MRLIRQLALIIIAAALIAGSVPARSDAGVYVGIGISVGFAPPALPV